MFRHVLIRLSVLLGGAFAAFIWAVNASPVYAAPILIPGAIIGGGPSAPEIASQNTFTFDHRTILPVLVLGLLLIGTVVAALVRSDRKSSGLDAVDTFATKSAAAAFLARIVAAVAVLVMCVVVVPATAHRINNSVSNFLAPAEDEYMCWDNYVCPSASALPGGAYPLEDPRPDARLGIGSIMFGLAASLLLVRLPRRPEVLGLLVALGLSGLGIAGTPLLTQGPGSLVAGFVIAYVWLVLTALAITVRRTSLATEDRAFFIGDCLILVAGTIFLVNGLITLKVPFS